MKLKADTILGTLLIISIIMTVCWSYYLGHENGKMEGIKIGKLQAENKPFVELVDMIKNHRSVFVVNKTDVAYLMKEKNDQ